MSGSSITWISGSSAACGAVLAEAVDATPHTRKEVAKIAINFFFIGISSLFQIGQLPI
jgi:hypothetical protein